MRKSSTYNQDALVSTMTERLRTGSVAGFDTPIISPDQPFPSNSNTTSVQNIVNIVQPQVTNISRNITTPYILVPAAIVVDVRLTALFAQLQLSEYIDAFQHEQIAFQGMH